MNWKDILLKKKYIIVMILVAGLLAGLIFLSVDFRQRKVTGFRGEKVDAGTIRLTWDPVKGCDGYRIYRWSKGLKTMEKIADIRSARVTAYEDCVNANKKQRYVLAAYKKDGRGGRTYTDRETIYAGGLTGRETIGHRGAMDLAPDDTIASFERAKKAGYTTFECDMFYTRSGDLFIFHDPVLEGLTGKEGTPSQLTEDNYLMYPITRGKNSENYKTQYTPDLNELLAWGYDHDMDMIIHIKVLDVPYDDRAFHKIAGALRKYHMEDRVLFFTSDYKVSKRMSRFCFRKGFLTSFTSKEMRRYAIEIARKNHCERVIMKYTDQFPVTADINQLAHEKGLKTCVYNIKNWEQIRVLINSRTDYWITNRVLIWPKS